MRELREIELFMLDMDGTIYLEDELIPGAKDFFSLLEQQNKEFVFMTNNSSKSKYVYLEKLKKLGIETSIENIISSINCTIDYLKKENKRQKIYLVGTEAFKNELIREGFDVVPVDYRENDVDYVIVGFDTELNYEKIIGACFYISKNVKYLATNIDLRCPIKNNNYIPDCGAIVNMIESATDKRPVFFGKPNKNIVEFVSHKFNVSINKISCVGDRLYTDIALGINSGAKSVCVLTGEATKKEISHSLYKPDYCFQSINELYLALK